MTEQKRTKRQLTIQVLDRIINDANFQIENLRGYDDKLANEYTKVRDQLFNRVIKLKVKERKEQARNND